MGNVIPTNQNINNEYTALGNWIGFCTGAPGPGGPGVAVLNECTGGSPAYARQATTFTPGTTGTSAGSNVVINVPPGTYPYAIRCSASSGNNMVDWCLLTTPIVVGAQTPITFTPSTATT